MPIVCFRTNLPDEKVTKEFHRQLSAKLVEVLGKPKELLSVTVETNLRMIQAGSFDPRCEVHIISIGLDAKPQTQATIQALTSFIVKHLGLPDERVVMSFEAPQPFMVGNKGAVKG